MENFDHTMQFSREKDQYKTPKDIIMAVYDAMKEKGYDPVNQFVGYITSGDPTYITSHKNARALMRRLDRDMLLEELVGFYFENKT
ncbi:MAG: IreB family regulatory phosphoprotein [Christensenellales bacterium]